MTQIDKVLYTGKTHTTGGRDGASRSSDGRLDVKLSAPGIDGQRARIPSRCSPPAGPRVSSARWDWRRRR